jgi:hypothetical protein
MERSNVSGKEAISIVLSRKRKPHTTPTKKTVTFIIKFKEK